MKLLYVYVKVKSRGIDIGISINPKFKVEYTNGEITVFETKYTGIEKFYANNIQSMNLIIGDNGVGKTTMLDIIGEYRGNRYRRLSDKDDYWFMLYLLDDGRYIIEGYNYSKISNLEYWAKENYSKDEYNIICKIENNILKPFDFSDSSNRHNNKIFYFPASKKNKYWNPNKDDTNNAISLLLERNKMGCKLCELYKFINSSFFKALNFRMPKHFIFSIPNKYEQFIEGLTFDIRIADIYGNILNEGYNKFQRLILKIIYNAINCVCYYGEVDKDQLKHIITKECNIDLTYNMIFDNLKDALLQILEHIYLKHTYFGRNGLDEFKTFLKLLESNTGIEIIDDFTFSLSLDKNIIEKNKQLVEYYDKLDYSIDEPFYGDIHFLIAAELEGMSSGEQQLLDLMSSLKYLRSADYNLIVLDEPDSSLHPEWSRMLVKHIVDILKEKKGNYEVIMTTHSPILSSDFFKENIIKLKADGNIVRRNTAKLGLASNIGDIFMTEFYLGYPMGEFIKNKLIDVLNTIEDKNGLDYILNNKDKLYFLCESIGDPVVSSYMKSEIEKKINATSKEQLLKSLREEQVKIQRRIDSILQGDFDDKN